ncbi:hypothetical protein JQC72_11705 [Polycladomyces sp. WAk]|uniref:SPOR domain-containing protein n=1 Tax=Polycladomyces zharkentensis TaxID=2807616 RepID=A0ABS2WKY0_9BACL|nr:hypothetical protein [Polycladomyces sp. WAk]MBN2910167.1 hypothetical protein [Polycladomyces sp. WAk]
MPQPRITLRSQSPDGKGESAEAPKQIKVCGKPLSPKVETNRDVPTSMTTEAVRSKEEESIRSRFPLVFSTDEEQWGEGIGWRSPSSPPRSRRNRVSLFSGWPAGWLILSIFGAVVLGTLMGMTLLSTFFSGDSVQTRTIDSHLKSTPSDLESGKVSHKPGTAIRLPSLQAVLLQAGSYSEKKGAQQTVEDLRSDGWAAVMTPDPPHRIYLGVGMNRDDALKLSVLYQKRNIQVYLKDWAVRGDGVRIPEKQARLSKEMTVFAEKGRGLFQRLGQQTVSHLQSDNTVKAFSGMTDLQKQYQAFVIQGTQLEAKLPKQAKSAALGMMQALDLAVQGAEEARKNPSSALIWQIQEGLVRYVLAYEQFVSAWK